MPRMTGGEAIVRTLEAHGVELVFGIPGTHNLSIYRHLGGGSIRHVTPRHEQGAGFAADGYARTTGRPGVCLVTTGPALTNIATAAAQSYSDSVPVLVISPSLPTDLEGKAAGFLHEAKNQQGAMANLLAWSHRATSQADAAAAIARAFAEFASLRPRPVHVEVPIDILESEGEVQIPAPFRAGRPGPDPEAVAAAARRLRRACAPALVLGGGARGAAPQVRRIVERLGAPAVTSCNGKGILPEDHPLALGVGLHLRSALAFLNQCDVVLAVGTELAPADMWQGGLNLTGDLIRVDIDPGQLHKNYQAAVAVRGDAAQALEVILEQLGPGDPAAEPGEVPAAGAARAAAARTVITAEAEADGWPWIPLLQRMREALPPDTVICGDSAMVCYYGALRFLPVARPNQFLYPTGYGTLGYGLPAAIGARLGRPGQPVVTLMGDGGFMFTAAEFMTAVQERLPLPVMISNNGGFGEIRREMDAQGIRRLAVDQATPDFPALGRALGGHGVRLDRLAELPDVLHAALAADWPTIIEVREGADG